MYNTFKDLEHNISIFYEHILKKYNDRLIVDVHNEAGTVYYTLWVDYHSRHTFTTTKWDKAFKRYKKFIEK